MKKILIILLCIVISILFGCTGNQISDDPHSDSNQILSISQINDIFQYKVEDEESIDDIARKLIDIMLNDISELKEGYAFYVTEYKKDFEIDITSYDSPNAEYYNISDNSWHVTAVIDLKYKGRMSPIGDDSNIPEGEYVKIGIGEWYIEKRDDVYFLIPDALRVIKGNRGG